MFPDNSLFIIFTILAQTLVLVIINMNLLVVNNVNNIKSILPFLNISLLLLSIFSILSIQKVEKTAQDQIKALMLKDHLYQVESLLKNLRLQKHEYGCHMQVILSLLELGKFNEARSYVNGLAQNHVPAEETYYTGHDSLTSLINCKSSVAQLKGIDFAVAIKTDLSKIDIPSWDLCSIIGNLIDNAMEAAIQADQPRVGLEFKYENDFYTTYIYNNGAALPDQDIFEFGFTTKDSAGRGYGLFLVKKLLNLYQGTIEITGGKKTTVILRLPGEGVKN